MNKVVPLRGGFLTCHFPGSCPLLTSRGRAHAGTRFDGRSVLPAKIGLRALHFRESVFKCLDAFGGLPCRVHWAVVNTTNLPQCVKRTYVCASHFLVAFPTDSGSHSAWLKIEKTCPAEVHAFERLSELFESLRPCGRQKPAIYRSPTSRHPSLHAGSCWHCRRLAATRSPCTPDPCRLCASSAVLCTVLTFFKFELFLHVNDYGQEGADDGPRR